MTNKINEMLLFQAVQIANNYSSDDVKLCVSALTKDEKNLLNKYLFDLQKSSKLTEDRIMRAIAIILDQKTMYLLKKIGHENKYK